MAKATYWQRGEAIDYTNATENLIEAGTVLVIGTKIGIAGCDIEPGALGSAHVEGVYKFAKGDAAIDLGAAVTYDATTGTMAAAESGAGNGYAVQAAAATDTEVLVKINA